MERLVNELENFNFQQVNKTESVSQRETLALNKPLLQVAIKNWFPNMSIRCDEYMPEKKPKSLLTTNTNDSDDDDDENSVSSSSSSSSSSTADNEVESDVNTGHDNVDSIEETASQSKQPSGERYGNPRKMPQRTAKLNSLRTPMKPPKMKLNAKTTGKLRTTDIKKIYTNNKLSNFRPTSLETIFEEPQQPQRGSDQVRLVGAKKLRRTLNCTNGLNTNKAIVNRRRAQIKKKLGRRSSIKKIPLALFLDYMENNLGNGNVDDIEDMMKNESPKSSVDKSDDVADDDEMESATDMEQLDSAATTSKTVNLSYASAAEKSIEAEA